MPNKQHLLRATLRALHMSGLSAAFTPIARGDGAIFMLHHVRPAGPTGFAPNKPLEITPDFLETTIQTVIEKGFEIVTLDEAAQRMRKPERGARPFACFTFDDGYRDNRDYAYPICRSYGVPMTIYVASDYADGKGQLWWLTLEDVIRATDRLDAEIDGRPHAFDCVTDTEKSRTFTVIYNWLRKLPDSRIRPYVAHLAHQHGIDPVARCRELVMNWDELRAFARDPLVTIGAHTLSHSSLAKLPEDEARTEMAASIARTEAELGRPCRHFSYPYGDSGSAGPREFALAAELGLATAVTTAKGMFSNRADSDPLGLARFSLNGHFQDERCLDALLSGVPFATLNLLTTLTRRPYARAA